jgi:uncharacterized protein with HEPN domain
MYPSQVEFLRHILDECDFLVSRYRALSFEEFCKNKEATNAACRSLEVIGEATKNVHPDIKLKYPDVDWKRMAGIRDVIIHDYFSLDFEIIWDTIQSDIPELKKHIEKIVDKESN